MFPSNALTSSNGLNSCSPLGMRENRLAAFVKSVFEISMLVSKFSCFVLLTMQRYGVIC